ncbi:MAG: ABC transporter substrate-binding protein [Nitrospirales bacterium]|nr:ABC transporter substrate-binding protein [Nitrospirales bacterium]
MGQSVCKGWLIGLTISSSLLGFCLFLSCFILAGTASADTSLEPIRFGLATAPSNLDPRFATDAASTRVNRLVYERLVDFDHTSRPIPALAHWEQLSPIHYRFYLDPNRQPFHDGQPLTAQDVQATYQFILDPQHASPHRSSLLRIDRMTTPNDATIDFFLTKPDLLFPAYLVIGILPAQLIATQHPFHSQPIGNGPFAFTNRPDDSRLILTRRTDRQPFEFVRVPDPTVRTMKLLAGEIDMVQNDLEPELVEYLAKDQRVVVQRGHGSNFVYIGFHLQDPLTKQLAIRQAVAHAIDRQAIIRFMLGGAARPASALLPHDHWAGNPALPPYNYNPQKARELLAQAGITPDRPIHLTYTTSSDPFRIRLATILQHQLAKVGIACDLRSYDWGTFYGDIKAGRFQLYSLSWVGIKTPDIFSYVFHSRSIPPHGANRGRFIDDTANRLIDEAETAQAIFEKREKYQQLQAYLLTKLPYVPLWFEDHVFIARQEIEGFSIAVDGNYDSLVSVQRRR